MKDDNKIKVSITKKKVLKMRWKNTRALEQAIKGI